MTNEIIKYEQQFEEIRGIITMHREKALRDVNEESLQMSWTVSARLHSTTAPVLKRSLFRKE